MPLLYGEGQRAFMRLQLEILGQSNDESIFTWTGDSSARDEANREEMLAKSPAAFRSSQNIKRSSDPNRGFGWDRPRSSMSNKGLEFHIPLPINWVPEGIGLSLREYAAIQLACHWQSPDGTNSALFVALAHDRRNNRWIRIPGSHLLLGPDLTATTVLNQVQFQMIRIFPQRLLMGVFEGGKGQTLERELIKWLANEAELNYGTKHTNPSLTGSSVTTPRYNDREQNDVTISRCNVYVLHNTSSSDH